MFKKHLAIRANQDDEKSLIFFETKLKKMTANKTITISTEEIYDTFS